MDDKKNDQYVECPKPNSRFSYQTGATLRAPVCLALAAYPARPINGLIEINLTVDQASGL